MWPGRALGGAAVLAACDEQGRQYRQPDGDGWVERDDRVVRTLSTTGWAGLIWSHLGDLSAEALDARIRAERKGP